MTETGSIREEIAATIERMDDGGHISLRALNEIADVLLPVVSARIEEVKADRQFLIRIYEERIFAERRGTHDRINAEKADLFARAEKAEADRDHLKAYHDTAIGELHQARAALARVRELADEHWDWKAGQLLATKLRAALASEGSPPAAHEFWSNLHDATCSGGKGARCGQPREHPVHVPAAGGSATGEHCGLRDRWSNQTCTRPAGHTDPHQAAGIPVEPAAAVSGEITGTIPGVTGYTTAELRDIWADMQAASIPYSMRAARLACMAVELANQLAPLREALRVSAAERRAVATVNTWADRHVFDFTGGPGTRCNHGDVLGIACGETLGHPIHLAAGGEELLAQKREAWAEGYRDGYHAHRDGSPWAIVSDNPYGTDPAAGGES